MLHMSVVNKMFERAVNQKSLSPAEVLIALNKAAVQLNKLNAKTNGDYKDYVVNFDRKELKAAWIDVKKTSLVSKAKPKKSNVRLLRDVTVGLVVDQGLSLKQVSDSLITLLAETGGKKQRGRYSKANLKILAYSAALITPAQNPAQ